MQSTGIVSHPKYVLAESQTGVTEPQRKRIQYLRTKRPRNENEEAELQMMSEYKGICEKRRLSKLAEKISKDSQKQHAKTIQAVNNHTTKVVKESLKPYFGNLGRVRFG